MAVALTNLSRWLWSGKRKETKISKTVSSSSSSASSSSSNIQSDSPSSSSSSSRRSMRRWRSREEEEGEIDKEYDLVLVQVQVQSDCLESDDLDWSIGWLEPHGSEFQGEIDSENSFAVLVPCYGRGQINVDAGKQSSTESKYMEKWISYLQKS